MRKLIEPKIVLASHNKGKLLEIKALLEPYQIAVISAGELGLCEPAETETSFAGNARIKAHFAAQETGLPALSDDSGLVVDALDGAPGVYTADWAQTGNGRDFAMAMAKTWDMLEARNAAHPRLAYFVSTLCLAWPDGGDEIFEGRAQGHLTWPMRGDMGFGYDPMFVPEGFDKTFAQLEPAEKAMLSHRSKAFALFKTCLGD